MKGTRHPSPIIERSVAGHPDVSVAGPPDAAPRYLRSVLVVDDDPSVRSLLELVLQVEGFEVRAAAGGEQALAMIAERRPEVLLVDVMMPGMDGRALTRQLRTDPATADLPIVICSALADDRDAWQAWASGANSFVSKPFDIDQLVEELAFAHRESVVSAHGA